MSIKKISKEQPENFKFNTKNFEIAKKISICKINKFKDITLNLVDELNKIISSLK